MILVAASTTGPASSVLIQPPRRTVGNELRIAARHQEIVSHIFVGAARPTKRYLLRCKRRWDNERLTGARHRPAADRGTVDKRHRGYREDLYRQS